MCAAPQLLRLLSALILLVFECWSAGCQPQRPRWCWIGGRAAQLKRWYASKPPCKQCIGSALAAPHTLCTHQSSFHSSPHSHPNKNSRRETHPDHILLCRLCKHRLCCLHRLYPAVNTQSYPHQSLSEQISSSGRQQQKCCCSEQRPLAVVAREAA